ncbi:MAG: Gfo/Idh/MocA family oxidoreductase [Gammaproteobacteria bacterium]|nr:Gfo/Idh/MocA family oxidoreductase [Gammaproteobacteria bacterium]MDH3410738.1 Gfo/Idh/MocA family oxidoreductase [Gammaproteobacteria bacterium]MDH3552692.1 Gfo/Idh/MocA family oxidoreductase [Gammaproteobacteria bacterium]
MTGDVIRIGLLGASKIAVPAIIKPAAEMDGVDVSAVAARDAERAAAYAAEHGIAHVVADYAALVASDDVDLVYNGLPPSQHMEWSIAAMANGKDVLCEKPFALNAEQAKRMIAKAAEYGRTLIEAFHYRFHPLFGRVLQIITSGEIGDVQHLSAVFNVRIPYRPGELRHELGLGGGALMDLGCYPVHWVRAVMQSEPTVISASARQERAGVDVAMDAVLEFAGGVKAELSCSMAEDLPSKRRAQLIVAGDKGTLTVINPVSPHGGHELIVESAHGKRSEEIPGETTYHHQLRHVLAVLADDAQPLTGGADAVANMAIIDAIYRAANMLPRGVQA